MSTCAAGVMCMHHSCIYAHVGVRFACVTLLLDGTHRMPEVTFSDLADVLYTLVLMEAALDGPWLASAQQRFRESFGGACSVSSLVMLIYSLAKLNVRDEMYLCMIQHVHVGCLFFMQLLQNSGTRLVRLTLSASDGSYNSWQVM